MHLFLIFKQKHKQVYIFYFHVQTSIDNLLSIPSFGTNSKCYIRDRKLGKEAFQRHENCMHSI